MEIVFASSFLILFNEPMNFSSAKSFIPRNPGVHWNSLLSFFLFGVLCTATPMQLKGEPAKPPSNPIPLWEGSPPRFLENAEPEVYVEERQQYSRISVPTMQVFPVSPEVNTGYALIVCPGGGYGSNDWGMHTLNMATHLNPQGITVVGLKYRTRPPHSNKEIQDITLLDGKRAIRLLRSRAKDWGIDPNKIGIVGYSAGANLAMNVAANFDEGDPESSDPVERLSSRPDFAVGCATWHWREKKNPFKFRKNSPPVFLVHATNDGIGGGGAPIELPREIRSHLEELGIPVNMQTFDVGAHGVGNLIPARIKAGFPPTQWPDILLAWLEAGTPQGQSKEHISDSTSPTTDSTTQHPNQ